MARHAVDMSRSIDKFIGSRLYLAMTRDRSEVLATAESIEDLLATVRREGLVNYVVVKAPDSRRSGRIY